MSSLVERLSDGRHRVEVSLRPAQTLDALKECIDRGYVHIRFTETRGGTELGFSIDESLSDLSAGDLTAGTGRLKLGGTLTLDFVKVRCIADIELPEMSGLGNLEIVDATQPA